MIFEWDPGKNKANIKKHGVSFEMAALVFKDKYALSLFDKTHSEKEERWITMGMIPDCNILVVIHLYRIKSHDEVFRIISARKATKKEAEQYYSEI
ncbi:MAG: BrnT family toxin [Oligoflexia bacterium]|nr:BrnT family toxin [Oligoflexia bacterium]